MESSTAGHLRTGGQPSQEPFDEGSAWKVPLAGHLRTGGRPSHSTETAEMLSRVQESAVSPYSHRALSGQRTGRGERCSTGNVPHETLFPILATSCRTRGLKSRRLGNVCSSLALERSVNIAISPLSHRALSAMRADQNHQRRKRKPCPHEEPKTTIAEIKARTGIGDSRH